MKQKWLKRSAKKLAQEHGTGYNEAVKLARSIGSFHNASPPMDIDQRLVAVGKDLHWIATALGTTMQVCTRDGMVELEACHQQAIQVLVSSPDSRWLLSCGDDKAARLWDTTSWKCVRQCSASKKVSAGCFSADSRYFFFGDKFGDVQCCPTCPSTGSPAPLLGHYCAIITALAAHPSGRCIASADRDGKLRVSRLPTDPTEGAWEIEAYCLGHTASVSATAFVPVAPRVAEGAAAQQDAEERIVLVSGGLDGKLIAWDHLSGEALCSLQLAGQDCDDFVSAGGNRSEEGAGVSTSGQSSHQRGPAAADEAGVNGTAVASLHCSTQEGGGDEGAEMADEVGDEGEERRVVSQQAGIVKLAAAGRGGLLAVVVESSDEIVLVRLSALSTSANDRAVAFDMHVLNSVATSVMLPSALCFGNDALWVAGGPCNEGDVSFHLGCLRHEGATWLEGPWGTAALPEPFCGLERRVEAEDAARTPHMSQLHRELRKAVGTVEERAERKRRKTAQLNGKGDAEGAPV